MFDMVGTQLEYRDIVNNVDDFFIWIPVGKSRYFYDMQHVNTKWETLNIQKK